MKTTVRSKYSRKLNSPEAVDEAMEALYSDLVNGEITVAEHKAIREEIAARLKQVHSAMKTVAALKRHERRVDEYEKVLDALARWRKGNKA